MNPDEIWAEPARGACLGGYSYEYEYGTVQRTFHNSFCSYIFASLLVAIIRLQQGAPREGGEASPPNQAFVGHVAMDIIWNLGDVERWNPNTPAPEYSRLEEPHLAINFDSSIYYDDDVHTCIMMAAHYICAWQPLRHGDDKIGCTICAWQPLRHNE